MINCELRKNLWLEFTPARLIISPIVVCAIVAIVYLTQDTSQKFFEALLLTSGVLTGFILLLWAMKLASESITSEVTDRTWVFQKMSSISALNMTTGKLFGSTAYAWYSATFCILAYIISAVNLENSLLRLEFLLFLILVAIVGHSVSILFSLNVVKNARFTGKMGKNSVFIFGVGAGLFILSMSRSLFLKSAVQIEWFSCSVNIVDFLLFSAIYAAFCGVIGLYRMMRAELQYDNSPVFWCSFVLSLLVYCNGLAMGSTEIKQILQGNIVIWFSFFILTFLSYLTLMIESFDPVDLRKVIDRTSKGRWVEATYYTPLWVPTIAGMLVLAVIIILKEFISIPTLFYPNPSYTSQQFSLSYLPLSILLLIARDLCIVGLVKSSGTRKSNFYIAIYLASLYGLVPTILGLVGTKKFLHFFWPIPMDGFLWQVVPLSIEVVGVIYLVWHRRASVIGRKESI